jgi:hypothetical protein
MYGTRLVFRVLVCIQLQRNFSNAPLTNYCNLLLYITKMENHLNSTYIYLIYDDGEIEHKILFCAFFSMNDVNNNEKEDKLVYYNKSGLVIGAIVIDELNKQFKDFDLDKLQILMTYQNYSSDPLIISHTE